MNVRPDLLAVGIEPIVAPGVLLEVDGVTHPPFGFHVITTSHLAQ